MNANFDDVEASAFSSPRPSTVRPQDIFASTSRPTSTGSGIKLVLPPLRGGKPLKTGKKSKALSFVEDEGIKKAPRPLKLKPLKEVVTKLIAQIKKKDDYAFFLRPVDSSQTPGYSDVVKQPMDLGTMTEKARKGKYRTLEEFTNDFHLTTNNAKIFNPPGTIYHTEATRLEAWGDEHIAKAAGTVIEHETDWNIDIERDDSVNNDDADQDRDRGTPMDVDGTATVHSAPSPSAMSATPAPTRRARGPGKKNAPGTISESIDEEGRLPGSVEGIGAFPYGSDWARLMLALKLKGKKKRTKRERQRMEREGPPFAADGSLDYSEMDYPFSVLSTFAPDPSPVPYLTPLYPCQAPADPAQVPYPAPVNLPPDRPHPQPNPALLATRTAPSSSSKKRRHWTINRNANTRGRGRDRDDYESSARYRAGQLLPREAHALDYGSFAVSASEGNAVEAIRSSLSASEDVDGNASDGCDEADYGNANKVKAAEDYIRDVVYGGVDGLAYVRSLAQFVSPNESDPELTPGKDYAYSRSGLGMPLAAYVEKNFVDRVTHGRHRLLSQTALRLSNDNYQVDPLVSKQVSMSMSAYPQASRTLSLIRSILSYPIDIASLIHSPNELFLAESEWAGEEYRERRRKQEEAERDKKLAEEPEKNAAEYLAFAIKSHQESEAEHGPTEGPEMFQYALDSAAAALSELEKRRREGSVKLEGVADGEEEDPLVRKLRLSLLALAKRAPLDKIARLPVDLVPPNIRKAVTTLGT